MYAIMSNLQEAIRHTIAIQTTTAEASVLQSVSAAARVTVTVNQNCLAVYNDGMAAFARYQTVGDRDASYIEGFAESLQVWDEEVSRRFPDTP